MWKAACDLLYSELNGSEYDNNSRIQSCPVAEHSLWDRVAEISKKIILCLALKYISRRDLRVLSAIIIKYIFGDIRLVSRAKIYYVWL